MQGGVQGQAQESSHLSSSSFRLRVVLHNIHDRLIQNHCLHCAPQVQHLTTKAGETVCSETLESSEEAICIQIFVLCEVNDELMCPHVRVVNDR